MKRNFLILLILMYTNLLFSQYQPNYGPSNQWETTVSTTNGFIIFDNITLNDENIVYGVDDGSGQGSCPDMNCDIIGVMYNNIPVGWSYCPQNTQSNNQITLAVEFQYSAGGNVGPGTEFYPNYVINFLEPVVTFHFYDASEQKLFYNVASSEVLPMGNINFGTLNIEGDGISSSGYYYQGSWIPYPLGIYNEGEDFTDENGNEIWDEGEDFIDEPVCPLSYADNFSAVGGSGDEGICNLTFLTCGDENACNYFDLLNTCDDGVGDCSSNDDCVYPDENFNCSGDCLVEIDCEENCGGTAVEDCLGICSGIAQEDCAGICNGGSWESDCGCVLGDNLGDDCDDCAGTPNGTNWDSDCGCVGFDNSGDDCDDCAGTPNGGAIIDCSGICNGGSWESDCGCVLGDNLGDDCDDCAGTPNGTNWDSDCGCVGFDNSGDDCDDCAGTPNGGAIIDCAGVCNGNSWDSDCGCVGFDNSGDDCDDCVGTPNGFAFLDCLGNCSAEPGYIGNTDILDDNGLDCNGDCAGIAFIDLCGFCVGGETSLEECTCEDYEKDCAGNCPGTTYLGNLNEYQYSSFGVDISGYLINDLDGNLVLDNDSLIIIFGLDWYLGENGIVIGHDCNGECSGNNVIDCTEGCQPIGLNSVDNFESCCESSLIDCSGLCGGENITDDSDGCCFSGDIGCDGLCNSGLVSDGCGVCEGGNNLDSNGVLFGPDVDCTGTCFGDAIEQNYFEDIDNDGLGAGNSSNDCSANHFEGDGWVLNNTDEDDDCYSNWHDCDGVCDGSAIEDCLENCSTETGYIGNSDILDENGFDCNNDCDGIANIDDCGTCVGGNTDNDPCFCSEEVKDCLGNCPDGTTFIGNTGFLNEEGIDCDGVCNGDEYFDCLGSCSSDDAFIGNTGFLDEFGNNFAGECNGNEMPHYVYSFSEEINIPPNMGMSVFIHLEGFHDIPINEVTIDINYPIELFTPFEVIGINSFSDENYLLEYDIDINTQNIHIDLASLGSDLIIQDEDVIEITGFSGNGDNEFGEFVFSNITTTGNSSILEYLSYNGQIMISDFYVNLLGSVEYYSNGQKTANVELTLNGETTLSQSYTDDSETDSNGFFEFSGILPGSYLVTPTKNIILDLGSEISSMDASQIARGSVGLIELSAYQQLAADVTLNGNISGLDASKVARYNIGEIDALNESNTHWIFYPEELDIADLMVNAINVGDSTISADCVYDPNTLGNVCSGGQLVGETCSDLMVNSPDCPFFLSIRLGDVTGNWNPSSVLSMSSNREMDPIEIEITDNEFSLPIRILDSEEMEGIDISIQFNNELFRLENITFLQNELSDLGYNLLYHEEDGNITISSYAMMNLLNIEEFIILDFSIIESEFTFGEIQITEFLFNEIESESGFEIMDEFENSVITTHIIISSNILEIDNALLPPNFQLYQNIPNPFNPITEIRFDIPKASQVSIEIYDIKGEKIATLIDSNLSAGHHKINWDASNSPGGIYFYRLVTDVYHETHKMILLK